MLATTFFFIKDKINKYQPVHILLNRLRNHYSFHLGMYML